MNYLSAPRSESIQSTDPKKANQKEMTKKKTNIWEKRRLADYDEAEYAAYCAPGVSQVENNLRVTG